MSDNKRELKVVNESMTNADLTGLFLSATLKDAMTS